LIDPMTTLWPFDNFSHSYGISFAFLDKVQQIVETNAKVFLNRARTCNFSDRCKPMTIFSITTEYNLFVFGTKYFAFTLMMGEI